MKRIVQVALSFIFIASQVVCSFAQTNATLFKVTSVSPSFVREGDKPFFQFLLSNSTKFDWTGTGAVDDVVLSSCIYKNDLNRRSLTVFHVQRRLIELGLLEARKAILPFRDLFAVLFFVVIGSLIKPSEVINSWSFALLIIVLMILLKTIPTIILAKVGKLKARPVQLAVGISQIGEFSFVLGTIAFKENAISGSQFTAILLSVVISILASTLLVRKVKVNN